MYTKTLDELFELVLAQDTNFHETGWGWGKDDWYKRNLKSFLEEVHEFLDSLDEDVTEDLEFQDQKIFFYGHEIKYEFRGHRFERGGLSFIDENFWFDFYWGYSEPPSIFTHLVNGVIRSKKQRTKDFNQSLIAARNLLHDFDSFSEEEKSVLSTYFDRLKS